MSLAAVESASPTPTSLAELLATQRAAFAADPYPSADVRRRRLDKLASVLLERKDDIARAVSEDFGNRSRHETLMAEVFVTVSNVRFLSKNLERWMRRESRGVSLVLRPATAEIVPQPLGVVGVISPWNYPVQLAFAPVATALAAGNRVMLKPSELTPRTSALLAEMLSVFPADLVAVVQGPAEVGAAFAELPFDHLVFTGSTKVGRMVMQAAAKNLTPVTLELGGKSPAVVHPEYPIEKAAEAIAASKLFNAGQTCVSPDYVLVQQGRADAFVDAVRAVVGRLYPRLLDNPDYTSIVNGRHHARLQALLDDARAKGAELIEINPAAESFAGSQKLPLVIVRGATDEMAVMQEEIFGPILPIVEVPSVDRALGYVNEHPRPLALYYFDLDRSRVDRVLERTHSGGVTINECMLHVAEEHLPFGGVGPSGIGAYHGKEGFDALSHRKAVLRQPRLNGRWLILPPYGSRIERLFDWLL
ncbi:MAG: coniferyl aldehyde dehydrogenase [Myxococcota bacterium]